MIKKTMTAIAAVLCMNSTAYAEETDELSCLVEAVYHEARSESFIGQLAVANVIIERVNREHFPDTICGVVHSARRWKGKIIKHRCAFSYYCDGKSERINEDYEYYKVIEAATLVLQGLVVDNMEDVVYYHATYVNPSWASQKVKAFQIGKHIFYKER